MARNPNAPLENVFLPFGILSGHGQPQRSPSACGQERPARLCVAQQRGPGQEPHLQRSWPKPCPPLGPRLWTLCPEEKDCVVEGGGSSWNSWPISEEPVTQGKVCITCSVVSNSLQSHGLKPTRLLCPWGFSRQKFWSELPFFSPVIFPTQGSNPGLLPCRQILYHLSHQGSPHPR